MISDRYKLVDRIAVLCPDLAEWAAAFKSQDRIVSQTTLGPLLISTEFTGRDRQYKLGPPILFHTVIFGALDRHYQTFCSTWVQAEGMHYVGEKEALYWMIEGFEIEPRT